MVMNVLGSTFIDIPVTSISSYTHKIRAAGVTQEMNSLKTICNTSGPSHPGGMHLIH